MYDDLTIRVTYTGAPIPTREMDYAAHVVGDEEDGSCMGRTPWEALRDLADRLEHLSGEEIVSDLYRRASTDPRTAENVADGFCLSYWQSADMDLLTNHHTREAFDVMALDSMAH